MMSRTKRELREKLSLRQSDLNRATKKVARLERRAAVQDREKVHAMEARA
jgi:hypothetical protein